MRGISRNFTAVPGFDAAYIHFSEGIKMLSALEKNFGDAKIKEDHHKIPDEYAKIPLQNSDCTVLNTVIQDLL